MAYTTEIIRNVCLIGPPGAGKTALTEALLNAGGAVPAAGSIEAGTTVSDFHPRERELQHSLYPSFCHLDHQGIHVNVVDTPGYHDFYGLTLSVLPAVETAVVVVNAQLGVDAQVRRLMDAARRAGLCRVIVVNQMDAEGVDIASVIDEIQTVFGPQCLPLNLPTADGAGVVDCFFQPTGAETLFGSVETAHVAIVDQVVEVDEALMERYLEQDQELSPEQLHEPFEQALREGHLVPVCIASAASGAGIPELLRAFEMLMPNPHEGNPPRFLKGEGEDAEPVAVNPDPDAHVIARVVRVEVDPFKGRLAIVRVHQGTIRGGAQLYVGDARKPIKVTHLLKLNGDKLTDTDAAVPGDICAIPRIDDAHFDAVLHDSHDEDHYHLRPLPLPEPVYGLAVRTDTDANTQKISDALRTLAAEDPSLRVEHVAALNEIVLRGLGDMHLKTVLDEIERRYGLTLETSLPSIDYRETITRPAEGHYRHKKQSGGAGQFGEVFLRVEPLPRGGGFEFVDNVVGGVIPSQFIPAVESGVRQVLSSGVAAGYPMQDVKVTVYDGKHHAVDSKEVAFVQAGKGAFLDAMTDAAPIVMEPVVDVTFAVPADAVGGVTGDLAAMRGAVSGTRTLSDERIEISGQAPLEALQDYHSRLKSLSGGEGGLTMTFSHYAPVPEALQKTLADAYQQTRSNKGAAAVANPV